MKNPIVVEVTVQAPLEKVWECWNKPEHINGWAFASDDWEAQALENNIRTGGTFKTVMSAKDKSASFEFGGTYSNVVEKSLIEYDMGDGRHVKVLFQQDPEGVHITESFDPENQNTEEKQREGWQSILNNFKKYTEGQK